MDILTYAQKFYEVEVKYDLFNLKTENNIYFWQIKRLEIFLKLYDLINNNSDFKDNNSSWKKISKFKKIYSIFKQLIMDIKYYYKNKNSNNIYFLASRNKVNNQDIDIISNDLLNLTKNNFLIETYNKDSKNKYKNTRLILKKNILRKIPIKDEIKENINSIIKNEFNIEYDFNSFLLIGLKEFYIDYIYYLKFFKKFKYLKKVFVIQSGIQSGMFKALKDLNIESIELQHGNIGYLHPAYNYPQEVNKFKEKLYLPKNFFTFSEFWRKKVNYPVDKIIDIGNSFYSYTPKLKKKRNEITFITTVTHQNIIEKYLDFLLPRTDKKVNLKLHPNQLHQKKDIIQKYKNIKNLKIIFTEEKVNEIALRSSEVILVMSTAAYEVLQLGCNLKIISELDYLGLVDIFDLNNVILLEKKEDILKQFTYKKENNNLSFFDKFDEIKIKEILKEKNEK